jgi:toxin-antitoxin system PIN domain toxin
VIAVDTNILVYAHRADLPWHESAAQRLISLAQSPAPWAIPWPCTHEFFAKVTHPKIFTRPSSAAIALEFIRELSAAPGLRMLAESDGYWDTLARLVSAGRIVGPMVHDARIATLCLVHGVSELWTADRDFGRFPELRCSNPLVGA